MAKDLPGQATLFEGCTAHDVKESTILRTVSVRLTPKQGKALEWLRENGGPLGASSTGMKTAGFGVGILNRLWDLEAVTRTWESSRGYVWRAVAL